MTAGERSLKRARCRLSPRMRIVSRGGGRRRRGISSVAGSMKAALLRLCNFKSNKIRFLVLGGGGTRLKFT